MVENIRSITAIIAFAASIIISFIALLIPPAGEIDHSVLILIAQMFLFTASLLGKDLNLMHFGSTKTNNDNNTKEK